MNKLNYLKGSKEKMRRIVFAGLILLLMASCSRVQRGALFGGAGGAAAGAVIIAASSTAMPIAAGAIAGATAGGLIGSLVADKLEQNKMQKEIDNLKKQIEQKEKDNKKLGKENDSKNKEIARLKETLSQKEKALDDLKESIKEKEKSLDDLKKELEKLNIEVKESKSGISLTMSEILLFEPGSDVLSGKGKSILDKVADILKEKYPDNEINIEGHTDNQPIQKSGWKSNWELGSSRSLSVLHYLVEEKGLNAKKVSGTTYGEFRPVEDNSTPEGQAKNRRAVILILPLKKEK